jgi:hypothetical protein
MAAAARQVRRLGRVLAGQDEPVRPPFLRLPDSQDVDEHELAVPLLSVS